LVNPLGSYVPSLWISVCGSSEQHGSDLALDAQLEALTELHHKSLGVSVSGVRDQGQESVQVVIYRPVSLIIRGAFQSVNSVCFCIDWKELAPELLFEVGPGLDGKDASVRFLAKEVLGPPRSVSVFEKGEGPEDFLLVTAELLWGQVQIEDAGVKEDPAKTSFPREVWGRGEFWPCLLFRQSVWDWGRGADRRRRCGCQRRSDS